MRISDWSSDVCSSDLSEYKRAAVQVAWWNSSRDRPRARASFCRAAHSCWKVTRCALLPRGQSELSRFRLGDPQSDTSGIPVPCPDPGGVGRVRSEEHTSELQSLMRISYAVFCLKKKHINQY